MTKKDCCDEKQKSLPPSDLQEIELSYLFNKKKNEFDSSQISLDYMSVSDLLSVLAAFDLETHHSPDRLQSFQNLFSVKNVHDLTEAKFCTAWLRMIKEKQDAPDEIPNALKEIVENCKNSTCVLIWSFTFRALSHFDDRDSIRHLIVYASKKIDSNDIHFWFPIAEAKLESGSLAQDISKILKAIKTNKHNVLSPKIAQLWRQWLLSEIFWWLHPAKPGKVEIILNAINHRPPGLENLHLLSEWRFLIHRIALLHLRLSIAQGRFKQANLWMDYARKISPESWENIYFQAILSWAEGDTCSAEKYFISCRSVNPFQSRVRFEHHLLNISTNPNQEMYSPDSLPDIYDMLSAAGVIFFMKGQHQRLQSILERLRNKESPYSLRLIFPLGRAERIGQGKKLMVYMAERNHQWLKALDFLDDARRYNESQASGSTKVIQKQEMIHRMHRLYLQSRYILENEVNGDNGDEKFFTQFRKELGKSLILQLTGDEMFYRGLAAQNNAPDKAIADFRALVRQSSWSLKSRELSPMRLVYIGDQLLKNGLVKDACRAFSYASSINCDAAAERLCVSELIFTVASDKKNLAQKLADLEHCMADKALYFLLKGMCLMAVPHPWDKEGGCLALKIARWIGLPNQLDKFSHFLLELVTGHSKLEEPSGSFQEYEIIEHFQDITRLLLKTLFQPENFENLKRFIEIFGSNWRRDYPFQPEEVIELELKKHSNQADATTALNLIMEVEKLGIQISIEWKVYFHLLKTYQIALSGSFNKALEHLESQRKNFLLNFQED